MSEKRSRDEAEVEETEALANCLMLLSKVGETITGSETTTTTTSSSSSSKASDSAQKERFFECKTCNKIFESFQALGGHRASHKRLRLVADLLTQPNGSPAKSKKHKCSICGVKFELGQALGGHMRRHRAELEGRRGISDDRMVKDFPATDHYKTVPPVLKRSNSKRVFRLDLNLTPYENDLKFGMMIKIASL